MQQPQPSMLANLWQHRSLVWQLARRDMRQRYVGSFLGTFWAVLYPLVLLAVYTLVFGKIIQIKLGSSDDPLCFALYLFCGLVPWQMVLECMTRGAGCLIDNANMVKKTAFPNEVMPTAVLMSSLLHMLMGFAVFLVLLLVSGRMPSSPVVALVPVLLLHMLFCLGLTWFFAAANAYFRDIGHIVGAFSAVWFLLTPIVYPVSMIERQPEWIRMLAGLNPMMHIVQAYRDAILDAAWPSVSTWLGLGGHALLMAAVGGAVFARVRRTVVDVL